MILTLIGWLSLVGAACCATLIAALAIWVFLVGVGHVRYIAASLVPAGALWWLVWAWCPFVVSWRFA